MAAMGAFRLGVSRTDGRANEVRAQNETLLVMEMPDITLPKLLHRCQSLICLKRCCCLVWCFRLVL